MIPLSTPIGAKIICIETGALANNIGRVRATDAIKQGDEYTFLGWCLCRTCAAAAERGLYVKEAKAKGGCSFIPRRFRLPVTPEGLLSVPSEAPADLDRRTAPAPRKRVRA